MFTIMMHVCYSYIAYFVHCAIEYCLLSSFVCILILMYLCFRRFLTRVCCVLLSAVPFRSTRADRRLRARHNIRPADSFDIWHIPFIIGFTSSANYTANYTPGHRNCATLGFYEPFIDTHALAHTHFCCSYCTHSWWHCLACFRPDGLTYTHQFLAAFRRCTHSLSPFAEDRDVFVFTPHPYMAHG